MPKNLGLYNNDLSIPRKKDIDEVTENVNNKVSKSGDTMTGTLTVGSASLQTNGYVTGTWLKTTANVSLNTTPSSIAVLSGGWIYSRTPAQIKSDIGLGNVQNEAQYSENNPPPYPVVSVNGHSGEVNITATDVGALPDTTVIPTNNNQLTNGAGYITSAQVPVTSVNGMTGAVTIAAGGNSIVTQSAQPSGQKVNDLWFQT